MKSKEYSKPMLHDLSETELETINGGTGFVVVVGVLVAVLLVAAGYTVAAGVMVVGGAGLTTVAVGTQSVTVTS